jgi:predicted small lipoprotein YifL
MRRLCVVGSLFLLSACGQKGALYLPEPTREVVPAAPVQKDKDSEQTKPSADTLSDGVDHGQ